MDNQIPPVTEDKIEIIPAGLTPIKKGFWAKTDNKVFLTFILMMVISVLAIYFFESGINQGLSDIGDIVWWVFVTVTTEGYGDRVPETAPGRIIGVILMIGGIIMASMISGKVASVLVEKTIKESKGMSDLSDLSGHFVICGWKHDMKTTLEEIISVNSQLQDKIVLITSASPGVINELRGMPLFTSLHYIRGDFTDESTLMRANIDKASKVVVLADQSDLQMSPQEVDARTVMAVMTIDNLNKNIYKCAEILEAKYEKYLKIASCDEVIKSRAYRRTLLANASAGTGISHVVNALLDVRSQKRLEVMDISSEFLNRSFAELSNHLYDQSNALLVGLLENTGNFFSKKKKAIRAAQMTPDISTLVENLKNVKKMEPNLPIINPARGYLIKKGSKAIVIAGTANSDASPPAALQNLKSSSM